MPTADTSEAWLHSQPSKRMQQTQQLCDKITALFKESEQTYGSRRIRLELRKIGSVTNSG